jgi:nitroreductase
MAPDSVTARDLPLPDTALDQLFTAARTRNAWTDRPVSDDVLRKLYELTKFGPTAANTTPARFVFITSQEAKARLAPLMSEANRAKTLQAPVNVIIGMDLAFAETPADLCVVEVGLGGRFDASNVFEAPAVSVITPSALVPALSSSWPQIPPSTAAASDR